MPIYEYECPNCGTFERFQAMSDEPLKRCPECRRKVSRLISSSNFQLRGGGWYADGYDSKAAKSKEKKESTAAPESSLQTSNGTSSEAKTPKSSGPKSKKQSPTAG